MPARRPAVAARTTKPILSNIKAVAQDDALTLMASDLEVGIRYELRGIDVGRAGAAILPIVRLVQILRESADADVTTRRRRERDAGPHLGPGGSRCPAAPGDEFPDIPTFDDGGRYHELTAGVLRTMIRRTAFAADRKEGSARCALTGVLWEAEGKKARLVATDTQAAGGVRGPGDGLRPRREDARGRRTWSRRRRCSCWNAT